jgi:hypothetical protein
LRRCQTRAHGCRRTLGIFLIGTLPDSLDQPAGQRYVTRAELLDIFQKKPLSPCRHGSSGLGKSTLAVLLAHSQRVA